MSITRGREEKDKAKKTEHFSEAAKQLSNAKVLDDQEQLVHLGLGLLALAKVGAGGSEYLLMCIKVLS